MGVKFHRIFVNTGQWRECIWVDAEGKEHRRDFERHSASISTPNKLKGPLRHGCSFFNAFFTVLREWPVIRDSSLMFLP